MKSKASSRLWSTLFAPQDQEDIFANFAYSTLTEWLNKWRERLEKQRNDGNEREQKRKKRKQKSSLEEEEDEDFEGSSGEPLDNPVILEGPTSCGKTSMVGTSN